MEDLIIAPEEKTPGIDFSFGILLFHGRSILRDSKVFFEPLFSWVKRYLKDPAEITAVTIKLEYIDSQSTQSLFQILKLLQGVQSKGMVLMVNWFYAYGDLEMLELGEVIQGRMETEFAFYEFEPEQIED